MNTFDGYQLKKRNPSIAPARGKIENELRYDVLRMIIKRLPATNPSIPSIKFVKLMIAVPKNIPEKIKKIFKKNISEKNKLLKSINNIKTEVIINWEKYLIERDRWYKSSSNPTNAIGAHIIGIRLPDKKEKKLP